MATLTLLWWYEPYYRHAGSVLANSGRTADPSVGVAYEDQM